MREVLDVVEKIKGVKIGDWFLGLGVVVVGMYCLMIVCVLLLLKLKELMLILWGMFLGSCGYGVREVGIVRFL